MPLLHEALLGLYGTWRLACLDRGAARWFNRSVAGVWHSFLALALCYPFFLILLVSRLSSAEIARTGLPRILAIETIGYVMGWIVYPLIALPFCRWLADEERALGFIAAYNWSQFPQILVLIALNAIGYILGLERGTTLSLTLVAYLALLTYEGFIAQTVLASGVSAAIALVLLDLVLGVGLGQVTQSLY